MGTQTILRTVTINAPADKVWSFIGSEDGINRWFGSTVTMQAEVDGDYKEIHEVNGTAYHLHGRILAYVVNQALTVAVRIVAPDSAKWDNYTVFTIRLTEQDNQTDVTLEHSGFEYVPDGFYTGFQAGWEETIKRLEALFVIA